MHGVRPRIPGLAEDLVGLDHAVDRRLGRMRFGVDDIDPRRAHAGDDQEAPFQKRVPRQRGQRGGAGIPAEVVQLVSAMGHRHRMHDLAVGRRARFDVDDGQRIGLRGIGAQHHRVGVLLRRRLHRQCGRRVECGIWPQAHGSPLLAAMCRANLSTLGRDERGVNETGACRYDGFRMSLCALAAAAAPYTTLPGFISPSGSSACLIARIIASSTSLL